MALETATPYSAENSESRSVRAGKIKQTRNNRESNSIYRAAAFMFTAAPVAKPTAA